MRSAVIVASTRERADVYGVHGTTGLTHWTCLARRTGLHGGWEAVEWACLPPGGVSGEHLHTRTEEVYVILRGRGVVTLDGRPHDVAAGDAVLTGLGTRHGLRNTGTEPLEWFVIEMTAMETPTATGAPIMHSTVVTNLRRVGGVDPRVVFTGPLHGIEVAWLRPGERIELVADTVEHTVFVAQGGGRAAPFGDGTGEVRVPLAPGTALTLPLGTGVRLTAGPDGLEYVHAVLAVPGALSVPHSRPAGEGGE
ncbi:cupin domain-containing protein [Kitasatospora viridis]|uniref:Cupin domain n=1 Tax=Kitasatospora viridis TaxID=281105 RepID=A0A561TSR4_9ACTN|nr:cupin domain-containing protein [Kitasatospora viridis]TWF90152.1 cupin domain [Kitasatospora viridis]